MAVLNVGLAGCHAGSDRCYPNDVLVTGYDIIFFWVARMAFRHGISSFPAIQGCLDPWPDPRAQGRKMSKSLGNAPIDGRH
ncbi:MAG: class I tRNA ligase family protein [Holdemania massiliensis]